MLFNATLHWKVYRQPPSMIAAQSWLQEAESANLPTVVTPFTGLRRHSQPKAHHTPEPKLVMCTDF